jgi:hypothetical protein
MASCHYMLLIGLFVCRPHFLHGAGDASQRQYLTHAGYHAKLIAGYTLQHTLQALLIDQCTSHNSRATMLKTIKDYGNSKFYTSVFNKAIKRHLPLDKLHYLWITHVQWHCSVDCFINLIDVVLQCDSTKNIINKSYCGGKTVLQWTLKESIDWYTCHSNTLSSFSEKLLSTMLLNRNIHTNKLLYKYAAKIPALQRLLQKRHKTLVSSKKKRKTYSKTSLHCYRPYPTTPRKKREKIPRAEFDLVQDQQYLC